MATTARANVLGVGVSAIDIPTAIAHIDAAVQARSKGYICVTGVHGVMEAQADPALRDTLNRAFLNTPDGMPTVWVGRAQGHAGMRRVYGPDLMLEVFAYGASQVRHALESTKALGGEGYVFWGGREGYHNLYNTDMKRELDHLAQFLHMAVAHAKKIGFAGQFYIEPKPKEPTKQKPPRLIGGLFP